MKNTLAMAVVATLLLSVLSEKVTHKCTGCQTISCNNLCWVASGAGFSKTQICPATNCTLGEQFDLYGQTCSVNIKLNTCSSHCCTGYSPLNIKSNCAETQFNSTAIGQMYCANELANGVVAAISVSGVLIVIIGSVIVVCLVRVCCPNKEARSDLATVQNYSDIYSIKSYKPKEKKLRKAQSSLSHKKNKKLKRLSEEMRDAQKMSEFQKQIGSKVLAVNSEPVKNKRPEQSQIQNGRSAMQGANSNGPIILAGNSVNVSLGSGDSMAPLKIDIQTSSKPKRNTRNVDEDQC